MKARSRGEVERSLKNNEASEESGLASASSRVLSPTPRTKKGDATGKADPSALHSEVSGGAREQDRKPVGVRRTSVRGGGKPYHDPIYRIMHRLPRSDVLEVVKCKFGKEHCERAAAYFKDSFMKNPLRQLKLQIGCSGADGLHLFFPYISFHRFTLRKLDLSRNKLSSDDVVTLCDGLALTKPSSSRSAARKEATAQKAASDDADSGVSGEHSPQTSVLEMLDLSYNLDVGNAGAVYLLSALRHNTSIRAVLLVSVSIDDEGAQQLAPLLRSRPRPRSATDGTVASVNYTPGHSAVTERRPYTFFLNLNHNVISAAGTMSLGRGLPDYVSVTLSKQRLKGSDNPRKNRKRQERESHSGRGSPSRGRRLESTG